jgi:DNA-binding NarL/FixJ family response regulator
VREREVAVLAARGLNNPEIAQELGLSPRTVETHLHRVYVKLDLHDREALGHVVGA